MKRRSNLSLSRIDFNNLWRRGN